MTNDREIRRAAPAHAATLRDCLGLWQAARRADDPGRTPMSSQLLGFWLQRQWGGDPAESWYLPGPEPGSALALYRLGLPDLENTDRASLQIIVHPQARRRGLGGRLLRHAAARAAELGREVLEGEVRDGSAGDMFAAWAGAKPGIAGALRVLDLRAPRPALDGLRAAAEEAAAGYSLASWTGPVPEKYLAAVAEVVNAYADAPHDAGVTAQSWDAERVRERGSAAHQFAGARAYTIVAVHDATGDPAGLTELIVDPGTPHWGRQGLTAVSRQHRGHRLGLLLKVAMLDWLARAEPQVTRVETGNASDNNHMIAINEALGYTMLGGEFHTCELRVAAAPGASEAG